MAHENATPRPWAAIGSEKVVHRLDALTDLVVAEIETGNGSDAALIVEAVNAYDTLRAENKRLRAALKSASADVQIMADGLGCSLRGGQLRTIVRRISAALSEAQP